MKKYKLEIVLFIVNAIYMILELVASRVLSPYFGSSNLIWTSVIGIILLSTSIGNYIGGKIADINEDKRENKIININIILVISAILILIIPIVQRSFISEIISMINSIKIGAIFSTIALFFAPSMFIGMMSPIIIKLKMEDLENAGKTTGKVYALSTLGSIIGTFLGGFFLIPTFGSNQILFVLSIVMFLLNFILYDKNIPKIRKMLMFSAVGILINIGLFSFFYKTNAINGEGILNGNGTVFVNYDTQYGKVIIYNSNDKDNNKIRNLIIDKGNESASYIDDKMKYELVYEYTKYYDLMFNSSNEIKNVLMIGGAGYSYPKYYISHYPDKSMDVVEIDGDIVEIAKKYFFLDDLIYEFDLKNNNRLNLITNDGRVYLNHNEKKYDAILNDSFSGYSPAKTLTTKEAIQKICDSLDKNGIYLTNIISSIDGEDSKFLKSEIRTLKQFFKNVYVVPCRDKEDLYNVQNHMVITTNEKIEIDNTVDVDLSEGILLSDNYCPIETIIPRMYR